MLSSDLFLELCNKWSEVEAPGEDNTVKRIFQLFYFFPFNSLSPMNATQLFLVFIEFRISYNLSKNMRDKIR